MPQHLPAHRVKPPVEVEEADDSLRLLERLYRPVQKDAVEAALVEADAVLVMLVERVHGQPSLLVSLNQNSRQSVLATASP